MARTLPGQQIFFELEPIEREVWREAAVTPRRNTVAKIAAFHNIRPRAREIAERNKIHSVYTKLKRKSIDVPLPTVLAGTAFSVLAGDSAPTITGGYANYDVLDRPGRTGLTQFRGYDPIVMEVPIRFEWQTVSASNEPQGERIEDDIQRLERMAGRGIGSVSGVGRPGRVKVSTTDTSGDIVPLIPANYQANRQNPNPPLWVVSDIAWDDAPWRNRAGNRIRQLAVVTLTQYVSSVPLGPFVSVAERSRVRFARRPFQPSWRYT